MKPTDTSEKELERLIDAVRDRTSSISDQRTAFARIGQWVSQATDVELAPVKDLALRERARVESGLSLFPALAAPDRDSAVSVEPLVLERDETRILDVEIIAIYW